MKSALALLIIGIPAWELQLSDLGDAFSVMLSIACLTAEMRAPRDAGGWWAGPLSIRINALTFWSNVSGQGAELAGHALTS